MSLVVEEVKTFKQLKKFLRFPDLLYRNHPCYVPALKTDELSTLQWNKNPAFENCSARYWLAYRNGRPVGRIAAIHNKAHNEKTGTNCLRFGWIDFEEDQQVLLALLDKVEAWAAELGATAVHGPLGFTDFDPEGMLVEGFDHPATAAGIYNYAYYPPMLQAAGYRKDVDWIEYRVKVPDAMNEKLERLAHTVLERYSLTLLSFKSRKEVLPYTTGIFELINQGYAHLYGAVPLTKRQMTYYTKKYFSFLRPDFISAVCDANGKMAAVGITMPSLTKALQKSRGKLFPFGFYYLLKALKKNDTADLLIISVREDFRNKGLNAILMNETLKTYLKNGIKWVETNYQLEDNKKVQGMWDLFEKKQHKRRRCYIKYLNDGGSNG